MRRTKKKSVGYTRMFRGFKIRQTADGNYMVINIRGIYENHAHISKLETCLTLIKLIHRKQVPNSPYLQMAAYRLVLDGPYRRALKEALLQNDNKRSL